jgi:transcriptional regulator with XRE-family HTH domain
MSNKDNSFSTFIKEVMRRRKRKPSQLAADLGISHATISRWLSGDDIPNPSSCQKLANYSGTPVEKILSIVGHIEQISEKESTQWPQFREYIQKMYPKELDEDMITMIEDLIERRRKKRYERRANSLGN